jgi:hypothetical protein
VASPDPLSSSVPAHFSSLISSLLSLSLSLPFLFYLAFVLFRHFVCKRLYSPSLVGNRIKKVSPKIKFAAKLSLNSLSLSFFTFPNFHLAFYFYTIFYLALLNTYEYRKMFGVDPRECIFVRERDKIK